jgi:diguanylate cyclase (GGDEF)-like protein
MLSFAADAPAGKALPALLAIVAQSLEADGVLLLRLTDSEAEASVEGAHPESFGSRLIQLDDKLASFPEGPHPPDGIRLPSATTGWLGARPAAVAWQRIAVSGFTGVLASFWTKPPIMADRYRRALALTLPILEELVSQHAVALRQEKLQSRIDTVMNKVTLGMVLLDADGGSLVNPVAARLLDLPVGTGTAAQVAEAMAARRAHWRVHDAAAVSEVLHQGPGLKGTEYWELPDNGHVVQIDSRPAGSQTEPGRFWIFSDVTAIWSLTANLKQSVATLQVLNRELDREVKRRLDVEEQLRQYNTELENRKRAVERRALQSAKLAELLEQEKRALEASKQESDFLAFHDLVTGLMNRRAFEQRLRQMVETGAQNDAATAVMFIDLDNFKTVNDTLGHDAGDTLLKEVASRLTAMLRDIDLVARFGGDEFAIATSHAKGQGPEMLRLLADRVRDALQIEVPGPEDVIMVAATLGVATAPEDGKTIETLLEHADQAMYVGKRRGRNAVVFHADLPKHG